MKKVLSLVLVLALVLGSFGMAFADTDTTSAATTTTPKDVVGTDYEGAVTALSALGVVSGYEDGNYKPANIVTRAEMAKLIIAELGLTGNATGAKSTFTDLSGYGWAEGFIGYAQSLGIINGYGDGTFKPGQSVSYDEALTMIVSALGYTKDCKEMNGSWPAIYVQKARVLGLTDDVKAGGAVGANRGDIAIYLYNMLTANMGYADADGVYQKKEDKDGNSIKVISNLDAKESPDYAVITKADADNAMVNIRQYVGAYAKVFTMTKGKNDGDIIAVSDVKSDFITGEYKASDKLIKTADGTEYKLDDVASKGVYGTSKELDKDYVATEFLNGDVASKGTTILDDAGKSLDTTQDKMIVTVAADLSGKTVKGIYSVALWKANNTEKVDADDIATIKSNQTLLGKEFKLDDNDAIDSVAYELMGVDTLSDIKADNVVYVYTNNDDEISRVAVGTEVAKGEVTAVKEGSETKATIAGNVYLFAGEKLGTYNGVSADFDNGDLETGDEVQVYLDAYGYMYDYDAVSGKADNYAVVLEVGEGSKSIGSKREIKLFLADGTDKVFNVDNDVFKDDIVTGVSISDKWDPTLTAGAIVKYGVDKDGLIDSFEYLNDGKDYRTVTSRENNVTDYSINKEGYYDNEQIRTNAVIFSFEGTAADRDAWLANHANGVDPTDEDNYGVTTLEKVLDTSDVAARYITDSDKISAMVMYDYKGSDNTYGVVTEAKKISGDSDYEATFFIDGAKKTYGLSSSGVYEKARKGASFDGTANEKVFKLEFNASGEVKDLTPAWNDSADTYATAGAFTVKAGDTATFSNNTFKITGTQTVNQKTLKSAVVYKNDSGDFKVGSTSDLKSLNEGAKVWFLDTEDDDNSGLMNIIVVDNPDKAGSDPSTPGTSTADFTISTGTPTGTLSKTFSSEAVSVLASDGTALTPNTDYVVAGKNVIFTASGLGQVNGGTDFVTVILKDGSTVTVNFKAVAPTMTSTSAIQGTTVSESAVSGAAIAKVIVKTDASCGLDATTPVTAVVTGTDFTVTVNKVSTGVYEIVGTSAASTAQAQTVTITVTDAWGATTDTTVTFTTN